MVVLIIYKLKDLLSGPTKHSKEDSGVSNRNEAFLLLIGFLYYQSLQLLLTLQLHGLCLAKRLLLRSGLNGNLDGCVLLLNQLDWTTHYTIMNSLILKILCLQRLRLE